MKHMFRLFATVMFAVALFSACSKDDNKGGEEDKVDYVSQLDEKRIQLVTLRNNAAYGFLKGEYPEESKEILNNAILSIESIIADFKSGKKNSKAEFDTAVADAEKAKLDFKLTMRTEDYQDPNDIFTPEPAELLVRGSGGAGYIDFGYSEEFSKFGTEGNQAFTVELWVKVSQREGFASILGTYFDEGNETTRSGWMVNYFDNRRLRGCIATMSYHELIEPGFDFESVDEWVHFAVVMDNTVNNKTYVRVYRNGQQVDSGEKDFNYRSSKFETHMIGFTRPARSGGPESDWGINGSIKDFRLWKTAKTEQEIQKLKDKEIVVTGQESDLVCGWKFTETVKDNANIKDITGKFTAKLVGNYQWIKLN